MHRPPNRVDRGGGPSGIVARPQRPREQQHAHSGTRRAVITVIAGALAALAPAAVALAVKPARGASFSGHTSAPAVNGFRAPVTFSVSRNGRSIVGFGFGNLGCFGAGGLTPGSNPYTPSSIVDVANVKVSKSGVISAGAQRTSFSIGTLTNATTVSISGRFTRPRAVTGTITFSQALEGSVTRTCGPAKIGFTATGR